MSDRPLLVTGATGYLGRRMVARARLDHDVVSATSPSADTPQGTIAFDISDRTATLAAVETVSPGIIIHTAAVNPGQGSDADMWRVNVEGSRNIAEAAVAVGARLVAISTDVLHDGTAGPYDDGTTATPINTYGATKAAAETAVLEIDPTASLVRTSLMYALDEMDRGTAGFAERLRAGETVHLFSDVLRNPIWVGTLVEALLRLAETDPSGTLNIAGREAMTRETYGRTMLDYWGVDGTDRIEAATAAEVSTTIPLDVRLDSSHAEDLLGMTFPGVTVVLAAHE